MNDRPVHSNSLARRHSTRKARSYRWRSKVRDVVVDVRARSACQLSELGRSLLCGGCDFVSGDFGADKRGRVADRFGTLIADAEASW